ncbi:RNA methyltransferase [Phormidesmis sp. 146-33]
MSETALSHIRIVLVEPAGALNVGSIARILKNMGLRRMVLVNPSCDPLSAEARQMAVHAADLLESAEIVPTLPDALKGCQRAIATTVRTRSVDTPLEHPRTALPWLLGDITEDQSQESQRLQSALIFGSEDRGLSNEELKYAQRFVCIPSSPVYQSLNLAQAVAICCYELYQWVSQPMTINQSISTPTYNSELASLDDLEGYYQNLEELLLKIGYLHPHTASSRMEKFRRLLNRAYPAPTEVALLRGILRQVAWAIETQKPRS